MSLTIAFVGYWVSVVVSAGGWSTLTTSYGSFLLATSGQPLGWAYLGLGWGLVLLAAGGVKPYDRVGYAVFAGWAAIALPLGLRGEVLFPTVVAVVIVARRRNKPFSFMRLTLVGLAVLILVSTLRDIRQTGLSAGVSTSAVGGPVTALVELGGSLRPVSEVIVWHATGEEYMRGATYWAPLDRALYYVIPFWERPVAAEEDERISNVVVIDRVAPIGFSPVAEAYRNFGGDGVLVVMLCVGLLMGWLTRLPPTPTMNAILGMILVPLMINVRNSFISLPAGIVSGLCLLGVIVVADRLRGPCVDMPAI